MNIQPIRDKILVRPIKEEKISSIGLVIPDTVKGDKPEKGEVIAAGPGKLNPEGKLIPNEIKVGDKILFTKYSPNEIKVDDEELFILSESDVLAIIN